MNLPQPVAAAATNKTESRKNFLGTFIGTNRTGKSATAVMYAKKWRQYNDGPILAFDPQNNFADIADDFILFGDAHLHNKICSLRNGLLVLDDYKLMHQKNTPESWLVELMNFRAKWNVDIIVITHSPSLVLSYLTYYVTHYYIFLTQTQKDSFAKKIPNYELCVKANLYINTYVKMFNRGTYPRFPHIVVTNESDDLLTQNIRPEDFRKVVQAIETAQQNAKR